jgi:hypothetical protein
MTSISILGIHGRSNSYYPAPSGALRLSLCHGGELQGLCQLILCPIAHQYAIGVRQLHTFAAALRVPCRVLQDEAVGFQISIPLQKADLVFSWDLWCLWDVRSQGLLARNRCDARGALPSLRIDAETLLLLLRVGEEWNV